MDDITPVEEAMAPTKFDVLSFIEQTAYPEKMVTIFTDIPAAKEYAEAAKERADLELEVGVEHAGVIELTDRMEQLARKLSDSSMTFKLRGFAPGVVTDIQAKYKDQEDNSSDHELIAHAIVSVHKDDGSVDEHKWSPDEIAKLRRFLAEGEFVKLLVGVADVIFNAAVFEQATDAGFPGRRPDVAPEL